MNNAYSNEIKIVLNYALEEAARLGSYIATPDHLFLGILRYRESDAVKILESLGVDIKKVKKEIEDILEKRAMNEIKRSAEMGEKSSQF